MHDSNLEPTTLHGVGGCDRPITRGFEFFLACVTGGQAGSNMRGVVAVLVQCAELPVYIMLHNYSWFGH